MFFFLLISFGFVECGTSQIIVKILHERDRGRIFDSHFRVCCTKIQLRNLSSVNGCQKANQRGIDMNILDAIIHGD